MVLLSPRLHSLCHGDHDVGAEHRLAAEDPEPLKHGTSSSYFLAGCPADSALPLSPRWPAVRSDRRSGHDLQLFPNDALLSVEGGASATGIAHAMFVSFIFHCPYS